MDPEFPDFPGNRFLEMSDLSSADLDRPESRFEHEVGHGVIAATLQFTMAYVGLKRGEKGLGVFSWQMAAGMSAAAFPAFEKYGVVYESWMEPDEERHKLSEGHQIAVFGPGIREALIQVGSVGIECHPIQPFGRRGIEPAEPLEKGAAPLLIGGPGGRCRVPALQFIGEPFEKDFEPNQCGVSEDKDDGRQILRFGPVWHGGDWLIRRGRDKGEI